MTFTFNLRISLFLWVFILFPCISLFAVDTYQVEFHGVMKKETETLLRSASQLINLQELPPESSAALQRRANGDIPNFIKVLHSLAYFNAKVDIKISFESMPVLVIVEIETGPIYPFKEFKIINDSEEEYSNPCPIDTLELIDVGIILNRPALPSDIIDAESTILEILGDKGYPLSEITRREVIADQATKTVSVTLHVKSGPVCYFGSTEIEGNKKVKDIFFFRKIAWDEGDIYDPRKVEETQDAFEAAGLFNSISITHADEVEERNFLPIKIEINEAKSRSIGFGLGFATERGAGGTAEWENRNMRGVGEKLSFKANLWQQEQEGTLSYLIPDFKIRGQDLLFLAEAEHNHTKGFTDSSISLSSILERQLNANTRLSYGGMYKRLKDTRSDNSREYNLLKAPFQIRWSNANNLLDPTEGQAINLKIIPSLQFVPPTFGYCINTFTTSLYYPLLKDSSCIFAGKLALGSIIGAKRHAIPPSERFYAGSESTLRGYHYFSVSPLDHDHNKPLGGRSLMVYSLELRMRTSETLGWVVFYDIGNVYATTFPQFDKKVLQSLGVGFRYHTPVGPIRLDLAIPLSPRRHIDANYQIYLSIGQAF
jgi:translocation and assembly module TamA